jgi:rSAM/selenodomain-associated transferase 1
MTQRDPAIALLILAKAPEAGFAKTRLIPALGAHTAAELARRLLDHTVEQALQTEAFCHRELCVTPCAQHHAFTPYDGRLALTTQTQGELGSRMHLAFERILQHHDGAILIGTDAPALRAEHLDQAAHDLQQYDAVFVPALDGGYALIGLKQAWSHLFADITWSSAAVMQQTRERLCSLGLRWHEYPAVADIDRAQDLAHLPEHFLQEQP